MSCSKIFSGDLPELIYEIIKYFQNDHSTLHSCVLVNRLWCRLGIPLLWENPFSVSTGNYDFVGIYLHNLNSDLKIKLDKYKIIDNLLSSNTLFNYPSFIKYLNTRRFIFSIEWWSVDVIRNLKLENRCFLNGLNSDDFRRLIQTSLFKMFIENEVNLHTLDIEISYRSSYISYLVDIFELILQNRNFIHNVGNLKLYIGSKPCFSHFRNTNERNEYTYIIQIVDIHQNLKKVVLANNKFPSYQSLLLSKGTNTLTTIILYCINFNNIINVDKVFDQLNVLESVHIIYCSLDANFIEQIIKLTKPFKLKSLFIKMMTEIESLKLLLQKSGNYLENFGFGSNSNYFNLSLNQQILGIINLYCENIKFLDLYGFKDQIIFPVFNLIGNIKQNLNYLSINMYENNIDHCSTILRNLGQALPFKLKYLSLTLSINVSDLEIFLRNSQNTFIEKLLINKMKNSEDVLSCIKEYIMKKKRVKYLAIRDNADNKYRDLFSMEDEVKEFELYNIKIQSYNDLFIKIYEFIREMD